MPNYLQNANMYTNHAIQTQHFITCTQHKRIFVLNIAYTIQFFFIKYIKLYTIVMEKKPIPI